MKNKPTKIVIKEKKRARRVARNTRRRKSKQNNKRAIIVAQPARRRKVRVPKTWAQRERANQNTDNLIKSMLGQTKPEKHPRFMRDPAFISMWNKSVERACVWGLWCLDPVTAFNMPECRGFIPPIKGANKAAIFAAAARPSTLLQTYQVATSGTVPYRFDLSVLSGSPRGCYMIGAQPVATDYGTDNGQFAFFGHYDTNSDDPPVWAIPPLKVGHRSPIFCQFDDPSGKLYSMPVRANNLIANADTSQYVCPVAFTVNTAKANTPTLKYSMTLNRSVTAAGGCVIALRLLDANGNVLAEAYMTVPQGSSEVHGATSNWGNFVSGSAVAAEIYVVAAEQDQQLIKFGAIFGSAIGTVNTTLNYKIAWTSNAAEQMVAPTAAFAAATSTFWSFTNNPAYEMLTESERKTKVFSLTNVFIGTLTGAVKDRGGSLTTGFMPSGYDLAATSSTILAYGKNNDRNSALGGWTNFCPQLGRPKYDSNHLGGQFPDLGVTCVRATLGSGSEITGLVKGAVAFQTSDAKFSPMHVCRDELALMLLHEKLIPYIERVYCNPTHTQVFTTFLKDCVRTLPGYFHSAARIFEAVGVAGTAVAGALLL